MPKGRGRGGAGHKGQRRHFTNPDQLANAKEKKEKERQWRQQRGELSSEDESEEGSKSSSSEEESTESSGEEEGEEEKQVKAKGVQHLIEVENPNRAVKKEKKVEELKLDEENAQLSRREREELEKQRAKAHYQKMHAAGKTTEAKADLARLAIIKKQREEAAKRREEEIKAKEESEKAKANLTKKALGRKT
ncbi:28 kDa heat- and acid-stable phosphoprotein-like [Uloborus diversus]|uniref:28 kDa heat- and acid-stable phosphoprotein-like n=1 Tax=Uloborus diversus TaxID=327109 RepID=UPI00240A03C7|nr:28 kDa heat- and acid-stable phosphoprotein-like [Uloborus diversus]